MSVRLTEADLRAMYAHGESAYPEECCGVMIGHQPSGPDGPVVVDEVVSATNERTDSRHNRFLISPRALLEAQRSARERGLEVLGYYHSHPDHPAQPSEFDRDHAWPGTSYVIIAVHKGRVVDVRSWRLAEDRSRFDEETVVGESGEQIAMADQDKE